MLEFWIGAELWNFWPLTPFLVILWPLKALYVTVLTFFGLSFTDWLHRNQSGFSNLITHEHFGVQWHKDTCDVPVIYCTTWSITSPVTLGPEWHPVPPPPPSRRIATVQQLIFLPGRFSAEKGRETEKPDWLAAIPVRGIQKQTNKKVSGWMHKQPT